MALTSIYGKGWNHFTYSVTDLSVTHGKVHEYMGMPLYLKENFKVRIGMEKYLEDLLQKLPKDMNGHTTIL